MPKNLRTDTIIEQMNLDGRVRELYAKGNSIPKIFDKLKEEGHEVNLFTLKYWVKTRIVDEKKKLKDVEKKQKTTLEDASAEYKLTEALNIARKNYDECKNNGDEGGASSWFKQYNDLMEKLLKSAGTYERAKQEAQKEDDKKIEVIWVIRTVCDKCKEQISEVEQMHTITTTNDLQVETVKEQMIDEISHPSIETDGVVKNDE
jgi:hypothetical protein